MNYFYTVIHPDIHSITLFIVFVNNKIWLIEYNRLFRVNSLFSSFFVYLFILLKNVIAVSQKIRYQNDRVSF